MRILVLNPCSKFTKNVVRDVLYGCWCKGKRIGGGTVPPFALLQIATILKKDGNDVTFLDLQAEQKMIGSLSDLVKNIDIVIISTSTMSFKEDIGLLGELKKNNAHLVSIIFGSHPTFLPRHSLNAQSVDIIVRYEPYFILSDLVKALAYSDDSWKTVDGIGYRQDGIIQLNRPYDLMDLDLLPIPDVSFLPKKVDYYNPLIRRLPYITSVTAKGCPGRCTFCTAPYFDGSKMRFKSAGYVLKEIEYYGANGFREVYFRDDTFFVNKDRDREICEEILKRNIDISWLCNTRVDKVEKDLFLLAKKAGCHTVKIGIESGVQALLDNMKKGYKLEQGIEAFRVLENIGIKTHAHVMLGVPGENKETIKQTIRYALKLNPTTVTFGICTPYPGTPLYDQLLKDSPEIGDGTEADFSKLHCQGIFNEFFTHLKRDELEKALRLAYRGFYLRPLYLLKCFSQIKGIDDIKRIGIAGCNVIDFSIRGE